MRPGLKIQPAQRNASGREQDDRNHEREKAKETRGDGLKTLGGFSSDGFDPPVDEKGDPENGKEEFVEPEHARPPNTEDVMSPGQEEFLRQPAIATNRLREVLTDLTLGCCLFGGARCLRIAYPFINANTVFPRPEMSPPPSASIPGVPP